MTTPRVDLVVNTFERTYREVLQEGTFDAIESDNRFAFAERIVLINNVDDRRDAVRRAEALVARGEIDEFHLVDERLPEALATTGLRSSDLGRVPHFSDCSLVAVTLPGSPWLLYWDADLRLAEPTDWITPSIDLMESDPAILVANPNWTDPTLERETIRRRGSFAIGRGFSDQLYLVRRSDLARPIYQQRCVTRRRYPMAHAGYIFESRVDAYMRHNQRYRATNTLATYIHPRTDVAASYPPLKAADRMRLTANQLLIAALTRSPVKPQCCQYM